MTDRADEIARELIPDTSNEFRNFATERTRIASALRSYRNEGLEEAARKSHGAGWYSDQYLAADVPADVVAHNNLCWTIRDDIRSLKSKEPQG